MNPARGAAALAGLALAAAACGPTHPPAAPPAARAVASEVVEALAAAEASLRTLRGLADVRLEHAGTSRRLQEAAVLALPGKLRLETLQFGGASALILATDGWELTIFSPGTREFARGRASARAVQRLAGVAVEPRHLARLLAGLPPLPLAAADPRFRVEAEGDGFVAESVDGAFWQRLRLDAGGAPAGGELRGPAGPALAFTFEDLRMVGARAFPFRLRLEQPGAGRVEVAYRTVELNPPVDEAVFTLAVPEGEVRIVDLDALPAR